MTIGPLVSAREARFLTRHKYPESFAKWAKAHGVPVKGIRRPEGRGRPENLYDPDDIAEAIATIGFAA